MKTTEYPVIQKFNIEGVKHIGVNDAFDALQNGDAVMIDVREMDEVQIESLLLDRVLNHPMSVIMERLPYIAKDQKIIIACARGVRSTKIANLLNLQGYPNVTNLDGGLVAWKKEELPVESIQHLSGCGCNSGTLSKTDFLAVKLVVNENLSKILTLKI